MRSQVLLVNANSRSLLFIVIALSFSACAKKEAVSRQEFYPEKYITASCEYSARDGTAYTSVRSEAPIVTTYFGKTYNKDWLANIGHLSMVDTVAYIESTGIRVYRAGSISTKSCKNFEFLKPMPADIAAEWQKQDYISARDEFISGLYLPKGAQNIQSLKNNGVIIVREDANRWTLIHEFMHHNFRTQALLNGYDDMELQQRKLSLIRQIDEAIHNENTTNKEKVLKTSPLFSKFISLNDKLSVQYLFEEITVEAILENKYESDDLTHVPAQSYGMALNYIALSKLRVEGMYASLDDLYSKLHEMAVEENVFSETYNDLHKHELIKNGRMAQLKKLLSDRESALNKDSLSKI